MHIEHGKMPHSLTKTVQLGTNRRNILLFSPMDNQDKFHSENTHYFRYAIEWKYTIFMCGCAHKTISTSAANPTLQRSNERSRKYIGIVLLSTNYPKCYTLIPLLMCSSLQIRSE